jgi:hypothetical protein
MFFQGWTRLASDFRCWLKDTLAPATTNPNTKAAPRQRRCFRPVVEEPENRQVPATVVTIAAVADAYEAAVSNPGHVLVSLQAALDHDVTVNYAVSGTATPGVDYQALLGSLVIPAGQVSAPIVIQPIDDLVPELPESVIVTLAADPAYQLGEASQATVNIRNTETVALIAGTSLTFVVGYTVQDTTELPVLTAEVLPFGATFDIVHSEAHPEAVPPNAHTFGQFSWTPLLEQVGSHEVVFRVTVPGSDIDETSSLIIQVVPNCPPLVNVGGSSDTETDEQTQQFTWSALDDVGLAFVSATVTQDGNPIFTSADAAGSFNFDAYGPGTFGIAVTALDTTGQPGTARQAVTVSDDDTQGPLIVLGGSSGTESEALPQEFTWNVGDVSGLATLEMVIRQDTGSGPVEIYRTEDLADAAGSFNFDSYGLGTFALTVTATDGDNDWSGDGSTSAATRTVTVTPANRPPVLNTIGNQTVDEGSLLTFTATASDPDQPPQSLRFSLDFGAPAGAVIDPINGVFTWTPTEDQGPGVYTVMVRITDDGLPSLSDSELLSIEVNEVPDEPKVDLDIDSDNTEGSNLPRRTSQQDQVEDDATKPGKVLAANFQDKNRNGVPDWADGYDLQQGGARNDMEQFAPLVLELTEGIDLTRAKIRFTYSATDPVAVTVDGQGLFKLPQQGGSLRIWTRPGNVLRNKDGVQNAGDFIASGVAYTPSQLRFMDRQTVLYLEGVWPSSVPGDLRILVEVDPDGQSGFVQKDAIRATVVRIDLDVDSDNTNGFDEPERSDFEDQIETNLKETVGRSLKYPGKYVAANSQDKDQDKIVDFADGFNLLPFEFADDANEAEQFVPIVLEVSQAVDLSKARINFLYVNASAPSAVLRNADGSFQLPRRRFGSGAIRIWTKPGSDARNKAGVDQGGDFVALDKPYRAEQLGLGGPGNIRKVTLYVEGMPGFVVRDVPNSIQAQLDFCGDERAGYSDTDEVVVQVIEADLNVDSDNDGLIHPPGRQLREDQIEDAADRPGKFVVANIFDKDLDGIPDFADGYNRDGRSDGFNNADDQNRREEFTPIQLELAQGIDLTKARFRISYDASNPSLVQEVSGVYTPAPGSLRLWTIPGNRLRSARSANAATPGHCVAPGVYTASQLGFRSQATDRFTTLYVEGINTSNVLGDARIRIEVDPDGAGPAGYLHEDAVRLTVQVTPTVFIEPAPEATAPDVVRVEDRSVRVRWTVAVFGDASQMKLQSYVLSAGEGGTIARIRVIGEPGFDIDPPGDNSVTFQKDAGNRSATFVVEALINYATVGLKMPKLAGSVLLVGGEQEPVVSESILEIPVVGIQIDPRGFKGAGTGGQNALAIRAEDPINIISNPSAIVILKTNPTEQERAANLALVAENTAKIEVTDLFPIDLDAASITWSIAPHNPDGIAGEGNGQAGFFEDRNTGRSVNIYGIRPGRILVTANISFDYRGRRFECKETFEAIVVEQRYIPFRVNLISSTDPNTESTRFGVNEAVDQIRIANRLLRQMGLRLVADTDRTINPNGRPLPGVEDVAATGEAGFFRVRVNDNELVKVVPDGKLEKAIRVNDRNSVLQINYIASIARLQGEPKGYAVNFPGSSIPELRGNSLLVKRAYRIAVDEQAKENTMQIDAPTLGRNELTNMGEPFTWGLLITNQTELQGRTDFNAGRTIAHELAHVLRLTHRGVNPLSPDFDRLGKPQAGNIMRGTGQSDPFLDRDFDLIQTIVARYSPVTTGTLPGRIGP